MQGLWISVLHILALVLHISLVLVLLSPPPLLLAALLVQLLAEICTAPCHAYCRALLRLLHASPGTLLAYGVPEAQGASYRHGAALCPPAGRVPLIRC